MYYGLVNTRLSGIGTALPPHILWARWKALGGGEGGTVGWKGGLLRWAVVHPLMQNAEIVFRWWQSEMCVDYWLLVMTCSIWFWMLAAESAVSPDSVSGVWSRFRPVCELISIWCGVQNTSLNWLIRSFWGTAQRRRECGMLAIMLTC